MRHTVIAPAAASRRRRCAAGRPARLRRLRAGGAVYDLVAAAVLEPAERRRVAAAYVAKHEPASDGGWMNDALVFRLDRP